MSNITKDFPFHELSLANPNGIQGGAFFSKIRRKDDNAFFFQTPKCSTKNGIVITDKKVYCDLMFSEDNEIFLNFLQELERTIQHLIYEKRHVWFHNDMEMDNIEYFFNPIIRTYKKKYLVRTYIQQPKHIKSIKSLQIYDENENRLEIKDVTKESKIIGILEGLGIKFTSSSFHLELCLRQAMILDDKPIFHKCLIQQEYHNGCSEDKLTDKIESKTKITLSVPPTEEINSKIETHPPSQETDVSFQKTSSESQKKSNTEAPTDEKTKIPQEIVKEPQEMIKKNEQKDVTNSSEQETDINNMDTESVQAESDTESINNDDELFVEPNNNNEDKSTPIESVTTSIDSQKKSSASETLEKDQQLSEVQIDIPPEKESVHLKQPIEVYREIYKKAREKAITARRLAIQAFLEAKKIKNTFLAGEVEDSDDDLDTFEEI